MANKKWIIGGSITLLVILGLSMGVGAIIGSATKSEPSYINVRLNDKIYDLEKLDLGTDSTTNEEKASLLEKEFYSATLFGKYSTSNEDEPLINDYVLNSEYSGDWNHPYILSFDSGLENLQREFVSIKFLLDTENSSVFDFLASMSSTTDEPEKLLIAIDSLLNEAGSENAYGITGLDLLNGSYPNTINAIFELLMSDNSYLKDVEKDILIYTYLWQDTPQKAYDTIFTKELVYNSPSIVYHIQVDGEAIDNEVSVNTVAGQDYIDVESRGYENISISSDVWNGWISSFKNADNDVLIDTTIDENVIGSSTSSNMQGYEGIKFGTTAGSNIASNWTSWGNTWYADPTVSSGTSLTTNGLYSHNDILTTANLYISDTTYGIEGKGASIYNDSIDDPSDPTFGSVAGTRDIYAYNQLYPYMFRTSQGNGLESSLGNEVYSLFSNGNSIDGYAPSTNGEFENYIFNEWFGDDLQFFGEIYVAESLISHNSSLTSKALSFWNDKGFSIELSGSYETDLAPFLPEEIIYNN